MSRARESPVQHAARRVGRHLHWVRTQGLGRLAEEEDLNPLARSGWGLAKWRWRRAYGVPAGTATAVLPVGLRRSGTNMVVCGLERSPEIAARCAELTGRLQAVRRSQAASSAIR
jgi:hypothetical protein